MLTTSKSPISFDPVPKDSPISLLLSKYDEDHGCFITHLDRSPVSTKMYVPLFCALSASESYLCLISYAFLSPLAMNLLWATLIAWRIITAEHHYPSFTSFIPLHKIAAGHITQSSPRISPTSLTLNILFDLFLYFDIWPILRTFISGHLWLRIRYGFSETEIIFRRPSKWRLKLLKTLAAEERDKQFLNALYRAIDRTLVNGTTGILTGDDFWKLDYKATCEARERSQSGEIGKDTWKLGVWQKSEGSWAVWQVWKAHEAGDTTNWLELFKVSIKLLFSMFSVIDDEPLRRLSSSPLVKLASFRCGWIY